MFVNYGDVNFWENGILVDKERATPESVQIIYCQPFAEPDENGEIVYLFAECEVDTTASWLNRDEVCQFADIDPSKIDTNHIETLIQYAIACIEYYGVANFASPYTGFQHNEAYIRDILKYRMIAYDNLEL